MVKTRKNADKRKSLTAVNVNKRASLLQPYSDDSDDEMQDVKLYLETRKIDARSTK